MTQISYQVLPDSLLAVVRFVGPLTTEDLEAVRQTMSADPSFNASFRGVGDLRAARFEPDLAAYRAYVENLAAKGDRSNPWALLIDTPRETAFQMIWQNAMNATQPSQIFVTPEAAVASLCVEKNEADALLALLDDPERPLAVSVPSAHP